MKCPISAYRRTAETRGFDPDLAMQATSPAGDGFVFIDPKHPAYPSLGADPCAGAGTELKALLAVWGIVPGPKCKCALRANIMDRQGCAWCEEHMDEIVGWLREEAERRKLPFFDAAGRVLVRRAIRNARKKGTCK